MNKIVKNIIKDYAEDIIDSDAKVAEFKTDLERQRTRYKELESEITDVVGFINKLNHLIEMYAVISDHHKFFKIWDILKQSGRTDEGFAAYRDHFKNDDGTYDAKKLKTLVKKL